MGISGKLKKRIIASCGAAVLTASTVFGAFYFNSDKAFAKVTLRGIEDIVSAHTKGTGDEAVNPFTILEVVPKLEDATLGYLVGGEEPIHDGKSLKDMPSTKEREQWLKEFDPYNSTHTGSGAATGNSKISDNAFTIAKKLLEAEAYKYASNPSGDYTETVDPLPDGKTVREMEIRGTFRQTDSGKGYYSANDYSDAFVPKYYEAAPDPYDGTSSTGLIDEKTIYPVRNLWKENNPDNTDIPYRHTEAYREKNDYYTGGYRIQIGYLGDDKSMPVSSRDEDGHVIKDKDGNVLSKTTLSIYNWQYFKATLVTKDTVLEEGQWIFISESQAINTLESYGKVENYDEGLFVKRYNSHTSGEHSFPILAVMALGSPLMAPALDPSATPTPTPTPTPTLDPEATPAPTLDPSATPTPTGEPGATPAPTSTPDPTAAPEPTLEPSPTEVPAATPDPTPEPAPDPVDGSQPYEIDMAPAPGGAKKLSDLLYDGDGYDSDGNGQIDAGEKRTSDNCYYFIVEEVNSAEADSLVLTNVASDDESFLGRKVEYTQVLGDEYNSGNCAEDKGPYYVKTAETDDYVYNINPSNGDPQGDYNFTADYTKSVYQTVKYLDGIYNNEWFKQYVFDREIGSQCDNLYIDVVPVTPDQLTEELVDKANLIYFAGGRYETDISAKLGQKILKKVVEDNFPVILERSTYYANLDSRGDFSSAFSDDDDRKDKQERVNLTLLSLALFQNAKKVIDEAEWTEITGSADSAIVLDAGWDSSKDCMLNRPRSVIIPESPSPDTDTYASGNYISTRRSSLLKSMRYFDSDVKQQLDVSFVSGTVFVNDDWVDTTYNDDATSSTPATINTPGHVVNVDGTDNKTKVVYSDFKSPYSDGKLNAINGFNEIKNEYENEKSIIETYGKWEDFNSTISKATCIRYILNANNTRYVVKTKLNILDIEPYQSSQFENQSDLYDGNYINDFPDYFSGSVDTAKKEYYEKYRDIIDKDWVLLNLINPTAEEKDKFTINVEQLGTKEFIGRNEDLNATYDMIYIGMDTLIMNTKKQDNGKLATMYNDDSMNGLVYAHMGDSHTTDFAGSTKLAGNDITKDKLRELTEYVQAGYAVMVSDGFFNLTDEGKIDGINTKTVDSSSNMYTFIKDVVLAKKDDSYLYYGKNIFRKGDLEVERVGYDNNRKDFIKYINISKLELETVELPPSYNNGSSGGRYLDVQPDGTCKLNFQIKLKNDAALDSNDTTYDCKLYLDLDADGKFEEGEVLDGLEIEGQDTSEGKYHLTAGNTYKISRNTPDDYVGFLSWKLAFIQNGGDSDKSENARVRSAVSGFSAVPATGQRPVVKVLQIIPVEQPNNLDLTKMLDSAGNNLYDQVKDFDVEVTQKDIFQFLIKYGKCADQSTPSDQFKYSYYDYLCQFDMVVLGFTDCFGFNADEKHKDSSPLKNADGTTTWKSNSDLCHDAALAIREYALSGRSVLFTHDLSSYHTGTGDWGYYANTFWRDIQGMDRFGVLNRSGDTYIFDRPGVTVANYESVYDEAKLKGSSVSDKNAFADAIINRFSSSFYGFLPLKSTAPKFYDVSNGNVSKTPGEMTETVTAVNNGQITQYPFLITENIGDTFNVSATHSQYYQLNLDTDSTDKNVNDDVVVWYTISNKGQTSSTDTKLHDFYKAIPNDVRNNYYIYSKGNVMYTGSGHSPVTSDYEKKLFINTLIAAYNSGTHAPRAIFKAQPRESAAEIKSMTLPYDVTLLDESNNEGSWLENEVEVNFKVMNNNFKDSGKPIYAAYYIAVDNSSEATLTVGDKYYKEINPILGKFYLVTQNGALKTGTDDTKVLNNYKIYQTYFNLSDLKMNEGIIGSKATKIYVRVGLSENMERSGNFASLPADESISELEICTAQLFELE